MTPSWARVRRAFDLDTALVHLGTSQFMASHPRPVRDAIAAARAQLDADPVGTLERHNDARQGAARDAIALACGGRGRDVALTGNTTQGLGLLHAGLALRRGDQVLTTTHEHYSQWEALHQACAAAGARLRRTPLYRGLARDATPDGLVEAVAQAVTRRTRVVALTWVHSDTGLKLPARAIAKRLRESARPPLLVLDATHGFGVETDRVARLGFDAVAADLHKWVYGPRGTGFVWARASAWQAVRPTTASFTDLMDAYAEGKPRPRRMTGERFSPGGFHAFEHRWAVPAAFGFREWVGGARRIRDRVRALNALAKDGLADVAGVEVVTPRSAALSAGIVAFRVAGVDAHEGARRLRRDGIVATVAPYPTAYLRFTPGIYNGEDDVEAGVQAVARLARGHGGSGRGRPAGRAAHGRRRGTRPRTPRRRLTSRRAGAARPARCA